MIQRTMILRGQLVGFPMLGSIDCQTEREDKKKTIQSVGKGENAIKGYMGYLFEEEELPSNASWIKEQKITYVLGVKECKSLLDYDIVELNEQGIIKVRYRADSADNVIFITNNCNSNCIMCPDSENVRRSQCYIDYKFLKAYIELIPDDTCHLTITGGEPTLLKGDLIKLIAHCKERFSNTSFLMLTNGRTLSNKAYADALIKVKPKYFRVAIPIYSYIAEHHDAITRAKDSFNQAKKGIAHIADCVDVEIRIVIMKQNYKELPQIAKMIVSELENIKYVSFMGLELLGNAALHKEQVWIDYTDTVSYIEQAAYILLKAGIEPRIYNYPLCMLPEYLWSITVRSITDYKVRYKESCDECTAKTQCGGFFFSTIRYDAIKTKPIVRK